MCGLLAIVLIAISSLEETDSRSPGPGIPFGSGITVALNEDLNGQRVNLSGAVNSDYLSITGNYAAPSDDCTDGNFGTLSATKS